MGHILGMVVELDTNSATGDHIYIGVVGKGGGREFPLDSAINDFQPGIVTYLLGTVWQVPAGNVELPNYSTVGGRNDPEKYHIDLDEVDYVYIRKQGERTLTGDDAYQFDSVEVKLYASQIDPTNLRTFRTNIDLWLSNEFGHQVWLKEV